jgi:hypothetical protein
MALPAEQVPFDKAGNDNGKLDGAEVTAYDNAKASSGVPDSSSNNAAAGTSVDTEVTRLTYNSAKDLLQKSIDSLELNVKLTKDDINSFMKLFEAEQNKQIAKTVTSSNKKVTPGTGDNAVDVSASGSKTSQYVSFFKPGEFAQDFLWTKVNFADEANLGGKVLGVLADARATAESFQLMGVSDRDIRVAAKQIAMGKKTLASYKTELQQIAKKEYPQFADRFTSDPELTTYDIASPIINMLAKTWEIDPKEVKNDNPLVMSYMNYAGADGKGQQPSRYDLLLKAKQDPRYQYTQQANFDASAAAAEFARIFKTGL